MRSSIIIEFDMEPDRLEKLPVHHVLVFPLGSREFVLVDADTFRDIAAKARFNTEELH